jgi:hypothetical protein
LGEKETNLTRVLEQTESCPLGGFLQGCRREYNVGGLAAKLECDNYIHRKGTSDINARRVRVEQMEGVDIPLRFEAAAVFAMCRPTAVEPVKAILSMSLSTARNTSAAVRELKIPSERAKKAEEKKRTICSARACPATDPVPVTRLSVPFGYPTSSKSLVRRRAPRGVFSADLKTMLQPAARAVQEEKDGKSEEVFNQ